MKCCWLIFVITFIVACGRQENESEPGPALFPQPKIFPVYLDGGYITNTLTGDTIQPLINSLGDTIKTGVAIPTQGKLINPDSVSKPKIVKAGTNPKTVNAHPNVHIIPDNLTIIPVDESKLKRHNSSTTNPPLLWRGAGGEAGGPYILNSTGDTIPTGIPIPANGKIVPCTYPKSTPSLPLRMKDNAICDLMYLDVDQGMSSSYIISMLEDRRGNIWFGTDGGGVSKYDGKSFVHFTENEGLSNNVVLSILEDKSGNIWFGTLGGGASKFDGMSFTHFTENEGLSSNVFPTMLEDKTGNLWFGSEGGGVLKYDGKSFVHFTENEGFSNNFILSILEDKSGNLWFGTNGGGVTKYTPAASGSAGADYFVHLSVKDGLSGNFVRSILEDKSGNIWFGTWGGGVTKYVTSAPKNAGGKSFVHYTVNEGLPSNYILSIKEDKSGNIWFGTWGGGVAKYDNTTLLTAGEEVFVSYGENEGLSANYVWSILEDKSENLWFGTWGGGVSKYDGKSFSHYGESEGLSNNIVRSVIEDRYGNIWFGTNGGGVTKYNTSTPLSAGGKSFVHFTSGEGLSNDVVWSILEDKSGNLWFGTWGGGVSKYDGNSFTNYGENEGLSNNVVLAMLEDKSGNIWFGTNGGGLTKYIPPRSASNEDGSFVHFTENEGLTNNYVVSIMEDKSGNLWIGTGGGGISKFTPSSSSNVGEGSLVHFTEREGLANNYVRSVLEDDFGNIWFGTEGGVSKYDGKSLVHFSENEGLSNNLVRSIFEDKSVYSKGIWVSTEKGLTYIKMNEAKLSNKNGQENSIIKSGEITLSETEYSLLTINKHDGLKGLDFFANSAFMDSENHIWWGSGKCVEMLDLNKFEISEKLPAVFLKSIDINEMFVDFRNLSDSAKKEIDFDGVAPFENYPLNLKLPYNRNHLTFHFAAIDWAAPHKLKFQYKLDGLNDSWSEPGDETKADYRNIPYGAYTFKVRAIGESQIWGEIFEYSFVIHPPWWHTWWLRVIVFITILFSLYGMSQKRTTMLRARQKVLENNVEKRTQELQEEKKLVEEQKSHIEEVHKEITDSINYAKRIQLGILPTEADLKLCFDNFFVLYQPKDVVSGDFYWAISTTSSTTGNKLSIITAADCTGHGVPGAFMSMLGNTLLNQTISDPKINAPGDVLDFLNRELPRNLKSSGKNVMIRDGMDMGLCAFDFANDKLYFSGANNPLWIIRNNVLTELKADKQAVTASSDSVKKNFSNQAWDLQKGDTIYLFTDGYADQFGGPKGKKFKYKQLEEVLLSTCHLPLNEQHEILKLRFEEWKGNLEQVDDVLIIGIRI